MKIDQFLSVKDYFNYYVSGVLWWIDLLLIVWLIGLKIPITEWVKQIGDDWGVLGAIVGGVLLLIIPYATGFALFPIGTCARELWQGGKKRKLRPDPRDGVINYSHPPMRQLKQPNNEGETSEAFFKGTRLSEKEANRIQQLAKDLFGFELKEDVRLYFYPIRAYAEEYGGKAYQLAARASDLVNFMESLLVPAPLAVLLSGVAMNYLVFQVHGTLFEGAGISHFVWYGGVILAGVLAFGVHWMLVDRFFIMEMYRVRHVYRAFLAIRSEKEYERNNGRQTPRPASNSKSSSQKEKQVEG